MTSGVQPEFFNSCSSLYEYITSIPNWRRFSARSPLQKKHTPLHHIHNASNLLRNFQQYARFLQYLIHKQQSVSSSYKLYQYHNLRLFISNTLLTKLAIKSKNKIHFTFYSLKIIFMYFCRVITELMPHESRLKNHCLMPGSISFFIS